MLRPTDERAMGMDMGVVYIVWPKSKQDGGIRLAR